MIDLSTNYLGLKLPHPFMPGASPLTNDLDQARRLEDAGAAALVVHSLFEEQILGDQKMATEQATHDDSFGEALSYLPNPAGYSIGPDKYLEHLRKLKERLSIPVIASLNGCTPGGWTQYAKMMQEAGADALELNTYYVATDAQKSGDQVEKDILELVKSVKSSVKIPVAVKLSPFFTSLPHFAKKLDELKVDGIILFNRFYQPDIDVSELKVVRALNLSTSSDLLLRVHGLASISGRVKASLAVSGGVHTVLDAVKAIMSGASSVQMVSAILMRGHSQLITVRDGLIGWMEENEYTSVSKMVGSMDFTRSPDPKAFERLNYIEILHSWK
jgi:dihydroorotate dehydrogenase (fumarate)